MDTPTEADKAYTTGMRDNFATNADTADNKEVMTDNDVPMEADTPTEAITHGHDMATNDDATYDDTHVPSCPPPEPPDLEKDTMAATKDMTAAATLAHNLPFFATYQQYGAALTAAHANYLTVSVDTAIVPLDDTGNKDTPQCYEEYTDNKYKGNPAAATIDTPTEATIDSPAASDEMAMMNNKANTPT